MKKCRSCGKEYLATLKHFTTCNNNKDRLSSYCRYCIRRMNDKWYLKKQKEKQELNLPIAPPLKRLPGETDMQYCKRHNEVYPIIRSDRFIQLSERFK